MSKDLAILGTCGYVRDPERFSEEQLLNVLGDNSGNLMFQYAANRLIGGAKRFISEDQIGYGEKGALDGVQYLVVPAANHLRLEIDWSPFANYLENSGLPLIVLGLGAQSPKIGGESDTIEALKADPHVNRLASVIREQAAFVTVRGAYSQKVCEAFGIKDVSVLGCPSSLLNPDPNAGIAMHRKLETLKQRRAIPPFCFTAAVPPEIIADTHKREPERKLFAWLQKYGGLYVQQSGGLRGLRSVGDRWQLNDEDTRRKFQRVLQAEQPPKGIWKYLSDDNFPWMLPAERRTKAFWTFMERNGRFYLSAPDWIEEVSHYDLSIGTRLHGNMAAIAGGTPGVVIYHDSRTAELAQTMHLPRVAIDDIMAAETFTDVLNRVEFDGSAFDAWRTEAATTLAGLFQRHGIPVSDHLAMLASHSAENVRVSADGASADGASADGANPVGTNPVGASA